MTNGVDIVSVKRFEKYQFSEAFLNKYFCPQEVEYIKSKQNALQTIAGIYACKEAVLKALKIGIGGGVRLCEVCVLHDGSNSPFVDITPQINYYLSALNCTDISVSISHDGDYAIAFCVAN